MCAQHGVSCTCTCSCVHTCNIICTYIIFSLLVPFYDIITTINYIITSSLPHFSSFHYSNSAHHAPNNLFSNSPLGLSPHSQQGSQSPDRRISNSGFAPRGGSPLHQLTRTSSPRSPPPGSDCPHPTRMNSLTYRSHPPSTSSLNPSVGRESPSGSSTPSTQSNSATPQPPTPFQRTSSQPNVLFVGNKNSPNQRRNTISAEERIRLSLRVSITIMIVV